MYSRQMLRRLLSFTLLFHIGLLNAQLCGYDYEHLFILDIRHAGETKQAMDIKAWLVDEDGDAYTRQVWNEKSKSFAEDRAWILPCEKVKVNGRVEFPKAAGYYVITVRAYGDREEHPPVYQAKIVSGADTMVVRLPYAKSLNICENKPYCKGKYCSDQPMVHEDGTSFQPFEIVLGEFRPVPRDRKPTDKIIIKYDIDTILVRMEPNIGEDYAHTIQYVLRQIRILDFETLVEIQRFSPTYSYPFPTFKTTVRTYDVFGSNPSGIDDIVITTRKVRNEAGALDEYCDYFLYNDSLGLYERNAQLSDYPNVQVPDVFGPAIRLETKRDDEKETTTQYDLLDGQWVETHVSSIPIHVNGQVYLPPTGWSNCISFPQNGVKWLPVVHGVDGAYTQIFDTLFYWNACSELRQVKNMERSTAKLFEVESHSKEGSQNQIVFRDEQFVDPNYIMKCERALTLTCEYEGHASLTLRYFVVGSNTAVRDTATGKIICYRTYLPNGMTAKELWVDSTGQPRHFGDIWIPTGERIGTWHSYQNDVWMEETTTYAKQFSIMVQNADSGEVKIEQRIYGSWTPVVYKAGYDNYTIRCVPGTDSVRVFQQNRMGAIALNYAALPEQSVGALYLLAPGQEHVMSLGVKIPIAYVEHRFVIEWDWTEVVKSISAGVGLESVVSRLREKYPMLRFDQWKSSANMYVIDFSGVEMGNYDALLRNLIAEETIVSLSMELMLPDPLASAMGLLRFSVYPETGINVDMVKKLLTKHGFDYIPGTDFGGQAVFARYKGDVFDRSTVQAMNALAGEPGIKNIAPQFSYGVDMVPDDGSWD
ncbi:MAG: hypothetical protein JNM00_08485 [Flavobacteriales bacterium]|nr:hypothetical protein [Flavobacteriales bacterium]